MLHSGLVSVSFRALSAEEIIALVVKAGLRGLNGAVTSMYLTAM